MAACDNELIVQIRRGGKRGFAILVDRYKDRAMTLATRMLKNRQDAEEATQDAFVRAYTALGQFEGNSKFSTWFYRILYNVCLTRIGKRKDQFLSIGYEDDADQEIVASHQTPSPLSIVESMDLARCVRGIVEEMPEKYGTILSMFYLQELSHAEICEVTQLPLGTVKVHLFRARALFQERLMKEFEKEKVLT